MLKKKIYNEQPVEVAMQFEDAGLKRLHLVDLDGARLRTVRNWKILEEIAGRTKLTIDFGGGIQTDKDLQIVYNSGAMLATIGSLAVKRRRTGYLLDFALWPQFIPAWSGCKRRKNCDSWVAGNNRYFYS